MVKKLFRELLPIIIFFLVEVFFYNEIVLTLLIIGALGITFIWKYYQHEIFLFLIGLILGFGIEVGLGLIQRRQHWEDTTLWGVPLWLPLIWGYAFVVIRRVGNIIVDE